MAQRWKIYRLTFAPDSAQYVGRTGGTVRRRLWFHERGLSNVEVGRRWRLDGPPRVDILPENILSESDARRCELRHIRNLRKPINCVGVLYPPVWRHGDPPPMISPSEPHPRLRNRIRCSLCLGVKPSSEFHADRSRSSGLSSKCKDCRSDICFAIRRALAMGLTKSDGYRAAKAACYGCELDIGGDAT